MRGVQWWNSSPGPIGDPDALVWTNLRTLRRTRFLRVAFVVLSLTLATAAGTLAAFVVAGH